MPIKKKITFGKKKVKIYLKCLRTKMEEIQKLINREMEVKREGEKGYFGQRKKGENKLSYIALLYCIEV